MNALSPNWTLKFIRVIYISVSPLFGAVELDIIDLQLIFGMEIEY